MSDSFYKKAKEDGENTWLLLENGQRLCIEDLYQVFKDRLINDIEVQTRLRSSHIEGQYAESYLREKNVES